MAVTVENDIKSAVTITNDTKTGSAVTWDEATDTWAESEGTWDNPNTPMRTPASKNNVTIINDTKS